MQRSEITTRMGNEKIKCMIITILISLFAIRIASPTIWLVILSVFLFWISFSQKKIAINFENWLIFFVFLTYYFISLFNNYPKNPVSIGVLIAPPVAYFIGYQIIQGSDDRESTYQYILSLMALLTGAFAILGLIYKQLAPQDVIDSITSSDRYFEGRWGYDVWNQVTLYPTQFNHQFLLITSMIGPILISKQNKLLKSLFVLGLCSSIISSFLTATRTNIFLIVISMFLFIINLLLINRNHVIRLIKIHRMQIIFGTIGTIIAFAFLIVLVGKFQMFSGLKSSFIFQRFANLTNETFLNGRGNLSLTVLKGIFHYPLGNNPAFFAHNMWLDIARVSGILPAILMIIYSTSTFITMIKIQINRNITQNIKLTAQLVFVIMNIAFALEPMVEGSALALYAMILINGMTSALNRKTSIV